jgi:hypothetical protein
VRILVLVGLLLALSSVSFGQTSYGQSTDVVPAPGRILAATREQVGWLDLDAPRPTLLTNIPRPNYPLDVAALPGSDRAAVSVYSSLPGTSTDSWGGDLFALDLGSGSLTALVSRTSELESLDAPAWLLDGSALIYQHTMASESASASRHLSVEMVGADGANRALVVDDAASPALSPDGSQVLFVRSSESGVALMSHSLASGLDHVIVAPGTFLGLAYPRFSPDGRRIAVAAFSMYGREPERPAAGWLSFGPTVASAHGVPWEVWIMNADGSDAHSIPDLLGDDASITWSPDGSQLFVYNGWGGAFVDLATGTWTNATYLAGYGATAWLPS